MCFEDVFGCCFSATKDKPFTKKMRMVMSAHLLLRFVIRTLLALALLAGWHPLQPLTSCFFYDEALVVMENEKIKTKIELQLHFNFIRTISYPTATCITTREKLWRLWKPFASKRNVFFCRGQSTAFTLSCCRFKHENYCEILHLLKKHVCMRLV